VRRLYHHYTDRSPSPETGEEFDGLEFRDDCQVDHDRYRLILTESNRPCPNESDKPRQLASSPSDISEYQDEKMASLELLNAEEASMAD